MRRDCLLSVGTVTINMAIISFFSVVIGNDNLSAQFSYKRLIRREMDQIKKLTILFDKISLLTKFTVFPKL